jgi:hypothetical protein
MSGRSGRVTLARFFFMSMALALCLRIGVSSLVGREEKSVFYSALRDISLFERRVTTQFIDSVSGCGSLWLRLSCSLWQLVQAAAMICGIPPGFFASVDESYTPLPTRLRPTGRAYLAKRPQAKICAYFANAQVETRPRFGDDDGDPIT